MCREARNGIKVCQLGGRNAHGGRGGVGIDMCAARFVACYPPEDEIRQET
jgi:hypothetical protein